MKRLFIDIETTGLSKDADIWQIAMIFDDGQSATREYECFMRPKDDAVIEDGARVSLATLQELPIRAAAFAEFKKFLDTCVDKFDKSDKMFLVGWNNYVFDNPRLRALWSEFNDQFFGSYFWPNAIDTMCLASLALADKRDAMPNFRLGSVCEFLGIDIVPDKLHDAKYDVDLTMRVYFKSLSIIQSQTNHAE